MTFQDLGLIAPILSALRDLDYEKPSPIQEKAIPPALAGRDVLGCAQTGTGKTCAFAAPILQRLNSRKAEPLRGVRPIRSLILTPTRELALQIQESFVAYGKNLPLRSAVIFGGVGQQPQVDALKAGVDILVATPGRLQDLHDQGFVHVEKLEIFVLDEADRMLDMGFIHDVRKILKWLPQKKQTLFFSATMPPEVQGLVDSLLVDPVKVAVDPVSSPVEVIDQKLYYVDRGNKSKLLSQLIKAPGVKNALIFTRTKHGANKVAGDLQKAGVTSAAIHGNKSQTARQQALADFKAGRIKALVATDIAARGIDIEELSHVFNYNLPDVPETYVHRIGRTGRAGHGGTAVSFCEFGEKELLGPIEKLLKKPIPVVEGHPFPMENFEAPKRDKHGKIVNADDQEARQAARERKAQRQAAKAAQASAAPVKPAAPVGAAVPGGPSPKKGPAPAQTPAAGKRRSAGYKPSKTLDEALSAMAPKRSKTPEPASPKGLADADAEKQAAFERWMAEERRIQAQKGYRDPLAGEEIMDATARLLAPKGSLPQTSKPLGDKGFRAGQSAGERPAGAGRGRSDRPAQGRSTQPQSRTDKAPRGAEQVSRGAEKAPKGTPKFGKQGPKTGGAVFAGSKAGEKAPKAPAPKGSGLFGRAAQAKAAGKPAAGKTSRAGAAESPKPAPGKTSGASDRKDRGRSRRGRGPMEVVLNLGSQKDSTEQHSSLMKPYYFNPDED